MENSNNELDENSQINENNVNDENNKINLKYLEIKDNDLSTRNNEDKNVKFFQTYTPENLKIFSDFIKKIFLLQLINKFKANEILLGINKYKVKPCIISKIRKLKDKKSNFSKNQKIERMQFHINYINNKIYKIPINNEIKSFSRNTYYISKLKVAKKVSSNKNNYIPINESNIKIVSKKLNKNIISINKNGFRKGFFLSKMIIKQENNSFMKIQKFIKEKNKDNEKKEKEINNNIIYKQIQKQPCYINKIRKNNYMKLINIIQENYQSHLNKSQNNEIAFKKPLNGNYYFITKKRFIILNEKINKNKKNLNYLILLLNLFITKNTQEFIFQLLRERKTELISNNKFYYPFYLRTLQRILNYIQKNDNPNKKISLFFNEIFNIPETKLLSIPNSICNLSEKNKNKLINSNLFTGYEENDLINFISDFSEFDKNINNEAFIIERLKRIKLNDTNIFTLVKLIDHEFNDLVKGKYCLKCYNEINICNCNKEKSIKNNSNNDTNKSIDKSEDNLNFDDLSDDVDDKRQIHFFDYNKEDKVDNNILIKTKTANNDNRNQKLLDIILPKNDNINGDK